MGFFSRTLSRLDELKRALTRDPASRQFLALADEHRRQGQVAEAIEVLEQGLVQNPASVAGHVALGRLLQQKGRLDEALSSFSAALRLDPQNLVALRQTADLHLSRGDKVEAIKKLKLYRGLSPGDRDVNELIRQLDDELAAPFAPHPSGRPEGIAPPLAAPEPARPSQAFVPALGSLPQVPSLPDLGPAGATSPPAPADAPVHFGPASEAAPFDGVEEPRSKPLPGAEPFAAGEAAPLSPDGSEEDLVGAVEPFEPPAAAPSADEELAAVASAPSGAPAVTETLAELLRAQGHLGEARDAYLELARSEPDPGRARLLQSIADEISASRSGTLRGRLEAWVEPFSRSRGPRDAELVAAVREVVDRLGPSAAVVTDFEGVPVVSAGARTEAEAMENLSAELTAFWKNVRRSRAEIGEGALDSLVLSGSAGSAAVKVITPAYALLLKAGPGIPAGRLRFEALRTAEQLRPALL